MSHTSQPVPGGHRRPWLQSTARVLTALSNIALSVSGVLLLLMTIIVFWQVFTRYVLNWSNSWTEVAALLLMSWFIFLGAAVGVRENFHLGFDVLLYILPKGSKAVLRTVSDLVVIAFAIGMVVFGAQLVRLQWPAKLPSLGITEAVRYLPMVGGGVLIVLFSLERIALRFSGVDVDRDVNLDEVPDANAVKEA
jgi:TRAP-type C4-dicarboxylate transport system permease small subunit